MLVAGHFLAEEIVFRPLPRQFLLQPSLQGDIGLGHDAAVELRMALHIGKTRQYLFLRELAHQVAQGFEVGKHQSGARLSGRTRAAAGCGSRSRSSLSALKNSPCSRRMISAPSAT